VFFALELTITDCRYFAILLFIYFFLQMCHTIYVINFEACMDIEMKQVVRGKTTTTRLFPKDLNRLKAFQRKGENLVLTLSRVLDLVEGQS
jgi:hypothetical protein